MRQVAPLRIVLLDQPDFPVTAPFLQRLLTRNCLQWCRECFHVDEPRDAVLFDELRAASGAMQCEPIAEIIADADIDRSVATACENVDVIGSGGIHCWAPIA